MFGEIVEQDLRIDIFVDVLRNQRNQTAATSKTKDTANRLDFGQGNDSISAWVWTSRNTGRSCQ